jgi:hypothetical protein
MSYPASEHLRVASGLSILIAGSLRFLACAPVDEPQAWPAEVNQAFVEYVARAGLDGQSFQVADPLDCKESKTAPGQDGRVCVAEVRPVKSSFTLRAKLLGSDREWTVIATLQEGEWQITGPAAVLR